jgi:hypothetical protein
MSAPKKECANSELKSQRLYHYSIKNLCWVVSYKKIEKLVSLPCPFNSAEYNNIYVFEQFYNILGQAKIFDVQEMLRERFFGQYP